MREYELEVLEQYDMEVKCTRKIRGAFFCETNEGAMLLKETKISGRRAPFLYIVLSSLEQRGEWMVDTPVFTRNGELVAYSGDGTGYMLKQWYMGRECDMKREEEAAEAAEILGRLHRQLVWNEVRNPAGILPAPRRSPLDEISRHNREMKKVRTFIRNRVGKNEFESLFLENFEKMYALAENVRKRMEQSGAAELYRASVTEKKIAHGDYNYHNLLVTPEGMAVTGFEHMGINIQVNDLYYLLRKAMEKCHWKQKLGRKILEAYQSERKLDAAELEYIGLSLAYPEKFWKSASAYCRSNKAWLPEKSVEKLEIAVKQSEEKRDFLENIFSF